MCFVLSFLYNHQAIVVVPDLYRGNPWSSAKHKYTDKAVMTETLQVCRISLHWTLCSVSSQRDYIKGW